jgi:hypothetical protein
MFASYPEVEGGRWNAVSGHQFDLFKLTAQIIVFEARRNLACSWFFGAFQHNPCDTTRLAIRRAFRPRFRHIKARQGLSLITRYAEFSGIHGYINDPQNPSIEKSSICDKTANMHDCIIVLIEILNVS